MVHEYQVDRIFDWLAGQGEALDSTRVLCDVNGELLGPSMDDLPCLTYLEVRARGAGGQV